MAVRPHHPPPFLPCPPAPACSNTALTSYAGGIYAPIYSGTNIVTNGYLEDHAVTLVGYGYDTTAKKHYRLIKNRCGWAGPADAAPWPGREERGSWVAVAFCRAAETPACGVQLSD
jgi:hypothetical protein